jgi:hypothetical protein
MAQPELYYFSPVDPREDEWRVMMRDHATRMRILREEMEKQNPTPLGFRFGPWMLVADLGLLGAVGCLFARPILRSPSLPPYLSALLERYSGNSAQLL